jgi:hypothetical protein
MIVSFCARAEGDVFERIAAQVSSVVMNYAISRRRMADMENHDRISGDGEQDEVHVRLAAVEQLTTSKGNAFSRWPAGNDREAWKGSGGCPAGAETSVIRFLRHVRRSALPR